MRQIPIEQFKRDMKSEIKDLPFIVTKRGKVLFVVNHMVETPSSEKSTPNHVVEAEKGNKMPESVNHVVEDVEAQLTDIVTRRQRVATVKSTIPKYLQRQEQAAMERERQRQAQELIILQKAKERKQQRQIQKIIDNQRRILDIQEQMKRDRENQGSWDFINGGPLP